MAKPNETTAAPTIPGTTLQTVPVGTYIEPSTAMPKLTDVSSYVDNLRKLYAQPLPQINTAQINQGAATRAGEDIQAQVRNLMTQQAQIRATGAQQARSINLAGNAAANITAPWAQTIGDFYRGLANDQVAASQGLAGQLGQASAADAQSLLSAFSTLGSSADPGTARAQALANTVGGLGNLGGDTLRAQAGAALSGALGIPLGLLGYGRQAAMATQGAAAQEANKLNAQISNVEATRGQLTRQYIDTLTTQALSKQQAALQALGLRADLVGQMGSLANASNQTKISLAQLADTRIAAHNAIVTADRNYNATVAQVNNALRHDLVSEDQAQQALHDADLTRQAQITQWAAENEQARINAQNSVDADIRAGNRENEQTRGFRMINGQPVSNPGYKIVKDKSKRGWHVERDPYQFAIPAKTKTSAAATTALAKAQASVLDQADAYATGRSSSSVSRLDPTTGGLQYVYPGMTAATPEQRAHPVDASGGRLWISPNGQVVSDPTIFGQKGGIAPSSFGDAVNKISQSKEGARFTKLQIAKMIWGKFYEGPFDLQGAVRSYSGQTGTDLSQAPGALTGLKTGPQAPYAFGGSPVNTPQSAHSNLAGSLWDPSNDQKRTMLGGLIVTRSGRFVDPGTNRYVNANPPADTRPLYWDPKVDPIDPTAQIVPGSGVRKTTSGRYVNNYGLYVNYP